MKRWRLVCVVKLTTILGAVRTRFDHVLSKFSGFSWERILFLKSACVNMVMQIQVQIGEDSEDTFYGFWFTLRKQ